MRNKKDAQNKGEAVSETPSLRFPLPAGGIEQARSSFPLVKRGEPLRRGAINKLRLCYWYYLWSQLCGGQRNLKDPDTVVCGTKRQPAISATTQ